MMALRPARFVLQVRLLLTRLGWSNTIVCLLWLVGVLAWLWVLPTLRVQENAQQRALSHAKQALQAINHAAPTAPPPVAEVHLAHFYDALGEARYAEQHIKTLFAVAAKTGLTLNLAEYKLTDEKDGRYRTYQIVLPVKGSYVAIRQFCEQTLLAMPFASLDDISFKRDAIGNRMLEARLRLTVYLADRPAAAQDDNT